MAYTMSQLAPLTLGALGAQGGVLQDAFQYLDDIARVEGAAAFQQPELRCPPGRPQVPPGPIPRKNPGVGGVGTQINKALDVLCHGRPKAAAAILSNVERILIPGLDPNDRAVWTGILGSAQAWVVQYANSVAANLRLQEAAEAEYQTGVREFNQSAVAQYELWRAQREIDTARDIQAVKESAARTSDAVGDWLTENWWKGALIAGGLVTLYAVGRGIAARL